MNITDTAIRMLEEAKDAIRANMKAKNINASGRTSASLRVVRDFGSVALVIGGTGERTAPLETLEVGRPGGAVPKGFYQIIKEWSRDKGITFANERQRSTFAYFTAKKIKEEGTVRHHAPVDVYTSVVLETADRLKKDFAVEVTKQVHDAIFGINK